MQTTYKGRTVTRQDVLNAFRVFDKQHPDPDAYNDWLARQSLMYVVRYKNRYYPPAHILSIATQLSLAECSGGRQASWLFVDLGFRVIVADNGSFEPPKSAFAAFVSRIQKWFSGTSGGSRPDADSRTQSQANSRQKNQAATPPSARRTLDGTERESRTGWQRTLHKPAKPEPTADKTPEPSTLSSALPSEQEDSLRVDNRVESADWFQVDGSELPFNESTDETAPSADTAWGEKSQEGPAVAVEQDTVVPALRVDIPEQSESVVGAILQQAEPEVVDAASPAPQEWKLMESVERTVEIAEPDFDVEGVSQSSTELLQDPYWYPRTWQELADLLPVLGRPALSAIPVAELVALLEPLPLGRNVVTALSVQRCQTLADVLETPDFIWRARRYLSKAELNLLLVSVTDFLRTVLAEGSREADGPRVSQATPSEDSTHLLPVLHADESREDAAREETTQEAITPEGVAQEELPQEEVSWEDVRAAARQFDVADLCSIELRMIYRYFSSVRARNALRRRFKRHETLYDLLRLDEGSLLKIPGIGTGAVGVLARDIMPLLAQLAEGQLDLSPVRSETTASASLVPLENGSSDGQTGPVQPYEPRTAWATIPELLREHDIEWLRTVPLSKVAARIADRRARNVVMNHFVPYYSLYDFLQLSEESLLRVPHFGPKTLDVLAQEIRSVLKNPLLGEPADEEAAGQSSDEDGAQSAWSRISNIDYRFVSRRQVEIVQRYHGRYGERETLEEIGRRFGLTRERVRQLKAKAGQSILRRFSRDEVAKALYEHARAVLEAEGEQVTAVALRNALSDPRVVPPDEQWILSWFAEIYGEEWYLQGLLSQGSALSAELVQEPLQGMVVPLSVADYLKRYPYTPLRLEDALVIAQQADPNVTLSDLRAQLDEDPEIVLFRHGEVQIGHRSWHWFMPTHRREARRVEWALRLHNAPATPAELAQILRERLGVLDATPYTVAEALENDAARFFCDDGVYGLALWCETKQMVEPLAQLLYGEPVYFPQLAERWVQNNNKPADFELVQATLHTNPDRFHCVKPLHWARADAVPQQASYDPSSITFDDLLPIL